MRLFKIKISDAVAWKNIIAAISSITSEGSFNITPDGIKLREMDPSHVAMVDFEWPKSIFDEYICDKAMKACFNISEMLKLLRRARKNDVLELELSEEDNKLNMKLRDGYLKNFSISLLQPINEEVPPPKVVLDAKARVTTSFLKDAVDDVSTTSDEVELELTREKMVMRGKGSIGSVSVELEKENENTLGFEVNRGAKAIFTLSYLSDIVKSASLSSGVATVEFSTDMPIRLNFELPNKGKLQYYLAPRIEH